MLSDEIRARLERLNRQILPAVKAPARLPADRPLSPRSAEDPPRIPVVPAMHHVSIDLLCDRSSAGDEWSQRTLRYLDSGVEVENPAGRHLSITLPVERFGADLLRQLQRVAQAWGASKTSVRQLHPDVALLADCFPHDALLLDLETCGLGGAMVFLIGLLHRTSRGLELELLLARNYAEERAILTTLWQIAAGKRLLVTFNGKSFDWPLVHDRSTLHRLGRREFHQATTESRQELLQPADPRPELPHFDVLHHARRRWRQRLPNCRLQTLERYLCHRMRQGDVPGHEIPQAYHEFVRSGDTRLMEAILHHNALDLVTMLQVAMRMLYESSLPQAESESTVSKAS